ncbi:hypothetical protein E8L99_19235 [Phreatobacter aquaticus]|uniref:Uncharacterized protein n=1 Tax=Phreatobacter aquaticus TaxID=2570229 RepID=A0A4D7QKZ2_9HYPH|nr:hypothetical protein [Phreatobacter aquaticus]QCK87735.1 hypothetical protein E8L99_19235 [Phreatobacter aquaticus]
MQYLLYLVIAALVLGYPLLFLAHRSRQERGQPDRNALASRYFSAETAYLRLLRREIAHILLAADIALFGRAFYAALEWQMEAGESGDGWKIEQFNALKAQYPRAADFDIVRTRHCTRYEKTDRERLDQMAAVYVDLSRLLMLDRYFTNHPKGWMLYDDAEIAAFREEVSLLEEEAFRSAASEAMKRFGIYYRDRASTTDKPAYEDDSYQVISLTGNPNRQVTLDTEYGITFKKSREYAVYSLSQDENDRQVVALHRSNSVFSQDFAIGPDSRATVAA